MTDQPTEDPDTHADDVAYDTDGWTNRQRAKLTETLLEAGVSHEWSGTELVVASVHEAFVDRLIYPEDADDGTGAGA
ncbi:MAG TPA: hypothetical protein VEI83_16360 [Acidimicrobiales bacterium]|nr:hypothetical protein [Acidimicrobiales bacterium]